MPANNRIYYATQLVLLNPQSSDGVPKMSGSAPTWYAPRGIQSVGIATNYNLTEVFSVGQLEVYDQPEDLPDVEVTMSKVFDGTPLLYTLCMAGSGSTNSNIFAQAVSGEGLTEVGNNRVNVQLGLYPDTAESAFGQAENFISMSGMYLSSFSYTFGTDDNFTEDVTLVGNHKVWKNGLGATGSNDPWVYKFGDANTRHVFATGSTGDYRTSVQTSRRMNLDSANSVFPTGSGGIHAVTGAGGSARLPYFQSITLSSDLGREEIRQLGRFDPYYRYITFPTEVTSEFEVVASEGDFLDADDFATASACTSTFSQLVDKPIKIKVCGIDGSVLFDLGSKNKVTSVNFGGGDAGGDNVSVTYSFRNFNSFAVTASGSFASGDLLRSPNSNPPAN